MPDIRSFFTPKGGAAAAPVKAEVSSQKPDSKRRSMALFITALVPYSNSALETGRKVVEDSDDEEVIE